MPRGATRPQRAAFTVSPPWRGTPGRGACSFAAQSAPPRRYGIRGSNPAPPPRHGGVVPRRLIPCDPRRSSPPTGEGRSSAPSERSESGKRRAARCLRARPWRAMAPCRAKRPRPHLPARPGLAGRARPDSKNGEARASEASAREGDPAELASDGGGAKLSPSHQYRYRRQESNLHASRATRSERATYTVPPLRCMDGRSRRRRVRESNPSHPGDNGAAYPDAQRAMIDELARASGAGGRSRTCTPEGHVV